MGEVKLAHPNGCPLGQASGGTEGGGGRDHGQSAG